MDEYKIQIVAYKGISFVSKLVRYWTRSQYSHVEALRLHGDIPVSLTSTMGSINFKGVQWYNIKNHTKGTKYDVYEVFVSKEQYKAFWKFMYSKIGKAYDLKGVFGFVFRNKENPNKYYCSELLYYAFMSAGINFWNHKRKYISPGTLVGVEEMVFLEKGTV